MKQEAIKDPSPGQPTLDIEISLGALRRNIRFLRQRMPNKVAFSAVVKSDAYGHGMADVSRAAVDEGCRFLIVCSLCEALELRRTDKTTDILIVGPTFPQEAPAIVQSGFAVAVGGSEIASALEKAAASQRKKARVHLKIDTGMGRFGFLDTPEALDAAIAHAQSLNHLEIEGVLTHFSEADEPESDYTRKQAGRFRDALERLSAAEIRPRWIHAANSGAVAYFPDLSFSMVRPGISMYGAAPNLSSHAWQEKLEPVMTVRTRVADLRHTPAGYPVSYGRTFVTTRPSRLALLPVGYGDGYPRHASGQAEVVIRGKRAPVAGRITMNLTVVDVTDIDGVCVGDPVLLFGRSESGEELRVEELARAAGTIPYEVLCNMGRRNSARRLTDNKP